MGAAEWWCDGTAVVWDGDRFAPCLRFTVFLTALPAHFIMILYIFFAATFYHTYTERLHRLRSTFSVCALLSAATSAAMLADATADGVARGLRLASALLAILSYLVLCVVGSADLSARTRRVVLCWLVAVAVLGILEGVSRAQQLADGAEMAWPTSMAYTQDLLLVAMLACLVWEEAAAQRLFGRRGRGKGLGGSVINAAEDETAPLLSEPALSINGAAAARVAPVGEGPAASSSPEARATPVSRLFFVWIWPLLARAYRVGSLSYGDLHPVRQS